jgi:hypothetical protein
LRKTELDVKNHSCGIENLTRNNKRNFSLVRFSQFFEIYESKNNCRQQRIKIIAILCLNKDSCVFATSEFPSEIPRTQTRNYSYTKPLCASLTRPE